MHPRARPFSLPRLLTVFIGLVACASPATAEVRRCERDDGSMIFTDKTCASMGAREHLAAREPNAGSRATLYRSCARSVQDLIFEITSAIDARDANRLASVYHWPGMSSAVGYRVLGTLDAIVKRPLVDITPLMSHDASEEAYASSPSAATDSAAATDNWGNTAAEAAATPPPARAESHSAPRQPIALRLDQTLADSATPSQTRFTLVRHLDCWWIEH